jgi:hypothetical protein
LVTVIVSALHVVELEPACSGGRRQLLDAAGDLHDAHGLRAVDHRHEEAVLGVDGDAHVAVGEQRDARLLRLE